LAIGCFLLGLLVVIILAIGCFLLGLLVVINGYFINDY
jgi:hypothetical protein